MKTAVTITFTRDEAVVLFELLTRLDANATALFEHPAEERIVWKIQGLHESELVEPFQSNYHEILNNARANVDLPET